MRHAEWMTHENVPGKFWTIAIHSINKEATPPTVSHFSLSQSASQCFFPSFAHSITVPYPFLVLVQNQLCNFSESLHS